MSFPAKCFQLFAKKSVTSVIFQPLSIPNSNKLVEKELLAKYGVSNIVLAEYVGVSVQSVSHWCTNMQQPDEQKLFLIAELLKLEAREAITTNSTITKRYTRWSAPGQVAGVNSKVPATLHPGLQTACGRHPERIPLTKLRTAALAARIEPSLFPAHIIRPSSTSRRPLSLRESLRYLFPLHHRH
jgi:transcriptional regulator with XRE-family HTH domain